MSGLPISDVGVLKNVRALGAQVVVTDELGSYKVATEAAGVDYQLCLAPRQRPTPIARLRPAHADFGPAGELGETDFVSTAL